MEKKRLTFLVAILMAVCHISADSYKVLYLSSPDIKIKNKTIAVGDVFADNDKIEWANDQQVMKVINLKTKRVVVLAAKSLKNMESTSLFEYLTNRERLSTRATPPVNHSNRNSNTTVRQQKDSTYYLQDTLYIKRPYINDHKVVASIVDEKRKAIDIPISEDGKSYVITKEMFNNQVPLNQRFSIKEYDKERDWEYVIIRSFYIKSSPMPKEK